MSCNILCDYRLGTGCDTENRRPARKRKRHQYLKKHDVRVAFADKMKKEKAREEKRLEKLGIKQDKPDNVIKVKEKKTVSSKFKKKISGKSKIKGTVKSKKR